MANVVVNVSANVAALKAGLADAASSIKSTFGGMSGSVKDVANQSGMLRGTLGDVVGALGSVNAAAALVVTGIGTVLGGMVALGFEAINTADNLRDMSIATGMSIADLQGLTVVAEKNGTTLEAMRGAFDFIARGMAKGGEESSKFANALEHFGVSMRNADGSMKSAQQIAQDVAIAYGNSTKTAADNAAMQDSLGKSYAGVVGGLQALNTLQEEKNFLDETGATVTQAQADASDEYNDVLRDLRSVMQGIGNFVAKTMLPLLINLANQFKESATNGGLLEGIINVLKVAFAGLAYVGKGLAAVFIGVDTTFQSLGKVIAGVMAMLANPGQAGAIWANMKSDLDTIWQSSGQRVKNLFTDIKDEANAAVAASGRIDRGNYRSGATKTGRTAKTKTAKEDFSLDDAHVKEFEAYTAAQKKAADRALEIARKNSADIMNIRVDAAEEASLFELDMQSERNRQAVEDQRMTVAEMLQLERDLAARRYEIQLSALEARRTIAEEEALAEGKVFELLPEFAAYEAEKAALKRGYQAELSKINREIYTEETALADTLRSGTKDAFGTFFSDVLNGTKSVSEAFKDLGKSILKMFLDLIAKKLSQQLFGSLFGTNKEGDIFSTIGKGLSGLLGGGRAGGGGITPGKFYMVGENGPELLRTGTFGNITPNSELKQIVSGSNQPVAANINFNIAPEALNMTLRDWFEGEIARNQATRGAF